MALDDLLGAVVDQLQPQADEESASALRCPCRLSWRSAAITDMLIRLFLNLLDNAVKYTPPGGQVVVAAAQDKMAVVVRVSDNGPGIAEEHLPHLFERFYRAGPIRMRGAGDGAHRGAGLGLAIAYEIVNAHGGELTVQSSPQRGDYLHRPFSPIVCVIRHLRRLPVRFLHRASHPPSLSIHA
ncbi:MAG: sensor histidine kinase [Caldilineaceae bacterium]